MNKEQFKLIFLNLYTFKKQYVFLSEFYKKCNLSAPNYELFSKIKNITLAVPKGQYNLFIKKTVKT